MEQHQHHGCLLFVGMVTARHPLLAVSLNALDALEHRIKLAGKGPPALLINDDRAAREMSFACIEPARRSCVGDVVPDLV